MLARKSEIFFFFFYFFFKYFFNPDFCNPFFQSPSVNYMNPMHTLVPVGTASNCPVDGSHLGSIERNHVFLRDMIRPAVASYHITVETFTGGSVARGRNHVIFLSSSLACFAPLCPAGGGVVHSDDACL